MLTQKVSKKFLQVICIYAIKLLKDLTAGKIFPSAV